MFTLIIYLLQERLLLGEMVPSWDLVKQGLETSDSLSPGLANCGWAKSGLPPAFVLPVGISQQASTESWGPRFSWETQRNPSLFHFFTPATVSPVTPCYPSGSVPIVTFTLRTLLLATGVHRMVESQSSEWSLLWATAQVEMAALVWISLEQTVKMTMAATYCITCQAPLHWFSPSSSRGFRWQLATEYPYSLQYTSQANWREQGKGLFPCYISTCIVLLILLIGPENLMYLISGPIKLLILDLAHRRE